MDKALIDKIMKFVMGFLSKNVSKEVAKPVGPIKVVPNDTKEVLVSNNVDWNDPKSKISKYFTIEEAIYLREWKRLANESDGLDSHVKNQLVKIFTEVMDPIRELLNKSVFVKSAYRPKAYNVAIGGAEFSAHMCTKEYAAVDFWTDQNGDGNKNGDDCDTIKSILMPKLKEMKIRMENNGQKSRWVHVDNKPVPSGGNEFFKP